MGGDEEVKEKVEIVGEKQEMKAGSHGFVNENAHLPNSAYKIPERH